MTYPSGFAVISAGRCPVNARSALTCVTCPFGHMTECHHPHDCARANCDHFKRTLAAEAIAEETESDYE
jgi:hypothetical protein